jgi:Ca2+/Na+ antiporter
MSRFAPHSRLVRELYFWSGILATICYRIIVVLNNYSTYWSEVAWYVGTIGFVIYFWHRYEVSEKRSELIRRYHLVRKIQQAPNLSQNEKEASAYILTSLVSTKEKWNYIVIFVASAVALIWGIYLDFFR